ncbi:uncharacterized protein RSE6_01156 [Rhynchosporium secalis]|uniref:Uncharacterized protein n=1 Tax=Rhynchosporium secalis TaxID=38038 RepID=A0A1E1LX52_RHYSE|nr:uncharacterized protein RSE6_01156 [Rhynchosporium secalis]
MADFAGNLATVSRNPPLPYKLVLEALRLLQQFIVILLPDLLYTRLFAYDRAGKYNSRGKKPDIYQSKRQFIAYIAYRIASISAEIRTSINSLAKASLLNAQILLALREEDSSTPLISKDISNLI